MPHIPKWSPSLSVHNAVLDEQHIMLIETANELLGTLRDSLWHPEHAFNLLEEMLGMSRRHDALEEELLASHNCPTLEQHRAIHRRVEGELQQWLTQAREGWLDKAGLARYVEHFMGHHLAETDMPGKGYLQG